MKWMILNNHEELLLDTIGYMYDSPSMYVLQLANLKTRSNNVITMLKYWGGFRPKRL